VFELTFEVDSNAKTWVDLIGQPLRLLVQAQQVLVEVREDWALLRALVKIRVNPGLLEVTNNGLLC